MQRNLTVIAIACGAMCALGPAAGASTPSRTAPAKLSDKAKSADTIVIHFPSHPVGRLNLEHPFTTAAGRTLWNREKTFLAQGDVVMQRAPVYALKLNYNGMEDLSFFKTVGPIIRELDLNDFPFDDEQAKIFQYLPNLQDLSADRTDISDVGVRQLLNLKKLDYLSFSRGNITGKAVPILAQLTRLRSLHITHNMLDDDSLASLPQLHDLVRLRLTACRISDAGVAHLRDMTKLEVLHLAMNDKITDKGVAWLGKMRELRELELGDTNVTVNCLPALKQLKGLKRLSISYRKFTPAGLEKIKSSLPGVIVSDADSGHIPLDLFAPLHPTFNPQPEKPPQY